MGHVGSLVYAALCSGVGAVVYVGCRWCGVRGACGVFEPCRCCGVL